MKMKVVEINYLRTADGGRIMKVCITNMENVQ